MIIPCCSVSPDIGKKQFKSLKIFVMISAASWCFVGCTAKSSSGKESESSGLRPAGARRDSADASRVVKLQAVIVTKGQQAIKLAVMDVHGSPLQSVRAALASVIADRQKLAQQIRVELDSLSGDLSRASERVRAATSALEAAREAARESYDKERPSEVGRSADRSSRSELDELLAKRKQQRAADQQFEDAMSSTGGLQRSVKAAQSDLGDLQHRQRELQAKLEATTDIDPFEYLPSPAKTWKTDADGVAQLSVPDGAQWVLWAANSREVPGVRRSNTEFYRWIVLLPESMDASETLYLDNSNLWQSGLPPWLTPAVSR